MKIEFHYLSRKKRKSTFIKLRRPNSTNAESSIEIKNWILSIFRLLISDAFIFWRKYLKKCKQYDVQKYHHSQRCSVIFFFISKIMKLCFSFLFDAMKQKFIETLRNHSGNTLWKSRLLMTWHFFFCKLMDIEIMKSRFVRCRYRSGHFPGKMTDGMDKYGVTEERNCS